MPPLEGNTGVLYILLYFFPQVITKCKEEFKVIYTCLSVHPLCVCVCVCVCVADSDIKW